MKKAVADKWIDALRSGKYEQTQGTLRDEGGFCCLGVLCDISGKGKWKPDKQHDFVYMRSGGTLPTTVRKWAELWDNAGEFDIEMTLEQYDKLPDTIKKHFNRNWRRFKDGTLDEKSTINITGNLAEFNDDAGASFKDIATFIEMFKDEL